VLFSNGRISNYINSNFEPVWQSVRPVPLITIDFGNGQKVKRTLHGNIATYVCTQDGTVVDILPGLYQPDAYLHALEKIASVANQAETRGPYISQFLHEYHKQQLVLSAGRPQLSMEEINRLIKQSTSDGRKASVSSRLPTHTPLDVVSWPEATVDTTINETVKRRKIHSMLAARPIVTPAQLQRWLYKEVLHCDLDDPYLGLQAALFNNYPFVD
jgi:hypothetical protein